MAAVLRGFLMDARNPQIAILLVLLFAGVVLRDWTLRADVLAATVASGLLAQIALVQWVRRFPGRQKIEGSETTALQRGNRSNSIEAYPQSNDVEKTPIPPGWDSLKSGLIASLSICLLLRTNEAMVGAFAGLCAIFSKALFRVRGKHFFNPSNFGIIGAVVFTGKAWISPGQWGSDLWAVLLIGLLGGLVTGICGRWDTTVAFLTVYGGLEALRNAYLGWTWDVFWHRLQSGSLLVFAFFMITDPRAIPNHRVGRIAFATLVAVLAFYLRNGRHVSDAVFWALFGLSPVTPVLDRIFVAPRYQWLPASRRVGFSCTEKGNRIIPPPEKMEEVGITPRGAV